MVQAPANEEFVSGLELSVPKRVLYAVRHSYPFSSNGYAVRTHGVSRALVQSGCDVVVCTSPGLPWNQPGQGKSRWSNYHRIDGVRYVHTPLVEKSGESEKARQHRLETIYTELIRVFKPSAVMAASNWANALPPARAAQSAGLPFFYEVRGFWELSRLAREPSWGQSAQYRRAQALEQAVARRAQRLFTLNRFMRDELVSRGVPAERIDLAPNGFDAWSAGPNGAHTLRRQLGIRAKQVVGYIGSFSAYEGLEDLIGAVARLRAKGVDLALVLVGSSARMGLVQDGADLCSAAKDYRALAEQLGIADSVYLAGRIDPAAAADYYGLLDLVVIPRRPVPVCELVSTLKPLEAAAHNKRVLMADVAPLAELRDGCHNFFYFNKGQPDSLAEQMYHILTTYPQQVSCCLGLEKLTWKENVRLMTAAIRGC